ncbi:MAG: AAA family ATPase [Candidatus Competibacteraceae bacterium]
MTWTPKTLATLKRLNHVKRLLKDLFVDRETAVELLVLASVCQEHLLLIGPPGTAKTELVNRYAELVDARHFHYLLTRFTEPSELFGPLDLQAFQQGTFHIRTEGMLPEAQIAFLDEVFQGSSAILNTLLTLVNERMFHNGSNRQRVPLLSLVGVSNTLPDDPWLQAFADRFVLRQQLELVPDERLEELLNQGWQLELQRLTVAQAPEQSTRILPSLKLEELLELYSRLAEVEMSRIQPVYANVVRELRAEGIELSDRRVVKGMKLIAAAALLREATVADAQDLWPLNHFWSRPEEAEAAKTVVQPRVAEAGGPALELTRPVDDILEDIAVLEAQAPAVNSEVALGAHLMALNRLRREILKDHRDDLELRQRIETVIQQNLNRLETMQP